MKGMRFMTEANKNTFLQRSTEDRTNFQPLAQRDAQILPRYPTTSSLSLWNLEACARYCLLSPSCDMFEYNSGTCTVFPMENRKSLNIYDILEPKPDSSGNERVYTLHCSTVSANLLMNSDRFTQSDEGWLSEGNCSVTLSQNSDGQDQSKHAVNGWHRFTLHLACAANEHYHSQQFVFNEQFPWDMDIDYFSNVNPRGYFRYWYKSLSDGADVHNIQMTVDLLSGGTSVTKLGKEGSVTNSEMYIEEMKEDLIILPEFGSQHIDAFLVTAAFHSQDSAVDVNLGPLELVLDVPFDAGCFKLLAPLDESPISESITPASCITKCLTSDSEKRFAIIANDETCYCSKDIPYDKLQIVASENETLVCSNVCTGPSLSPYVCGGPESVSIYVASNQFFVFNLFNGMYFGLKTSLI